MSKKPVIGLVLGAVVAAGLAVVWYANRTHTEDIAIGGRWTAVYRWWKISEVLADRNRDGRVDARTVFDSPIDPVMILAPRSADYTTWLDQGFDGKFELEIRWQKTSKATSVGIDTNGDGTYDKVLTGNEADAYEDNVIAPRCKEIFKQYARPGKDK